MMLALSLLVAGAGLYACGGFEEEDNPVSPQGNVPKVCQGVSLMPDLTGPEAL